MENRNNNPIAEEIIHNNPTGYGLFAGIGDNFNSAAQAICELADDAISNLRANSDDPDLSMTIVVSFENLGDAVKISVVDGGTVKSLKLEGEIRLPGDYAYIGSAVGRAKGGAVIEKILSNVNLTGEGKSRHIGGITGSSEKLGGTLAVTKCLYGGHIDLPNVDDAVGGIIGYANDNVTLSYCGFTGSVTANTKTGGILGYVNNKSFGGLTNCYGAGQASGALAGFLRNCGENLRHNAYDASQSAFGGGYEASITLGLANASSVSNWTTGQAAFLLNRKTVIKTSGDKVTETVEEHTTTAFGGRPWERMRIRIFPGRSFIGREQLHTATPSVRCMSYTAKNKEP